MTQANTVTVEDVVKAFGNSDRFPEGSPQFQSFSPFIGHVIAIVGEDHLTDLVGVGNLCDAMSRYVRWLAGNSEFKRQLDDLEASLVETLYIQMADQLQPMAENPQLLLDQAGIATEAEALEMDELGLNEAAKELSRRDELTFAKLLSTSPDIFIPRS